MEPELSILLFRRVGWSAADYQAWSDAELESGRSFVVPTAWHGEVLLRLCIVNPLTTVDDIGLIVDSLARSTGTARASEPRTSAADLVIAHARCVATMDGERAGTRGWLGGRHRRSGQRRR